MAVVLRRCLYRELETFQEASVQCFDACSLQPHLGMLALALWHMCVESRWAGVSRSRQLLLDLPNAVTDLSACIPYNYFVYIFHK